MEMILTGAPIAADEAQRIGLVNRVVPAADLMTEARALAAQLAQKAPIAMRYIIDAINKGVEMPFAEALRSSRRRCSVLSRRPTTCAKARGVSREAQAGVQGHGRAACGATGRSTARDAGPSEASLPSDSADDQGTGRASGLPVRGRRVEVQRLRDRSAAGRRARGAGGGRRRVERHHGRARAGRVRDPARGAARGRERALRRDRLPRLPDPRARPPHFEYIASAVAHGLTAAAAATGVPMAFGVLTTNSVEEALARAGDGTGEQGSGGGGGRDRDGAGRRAAGAAGDAEGRSMTRTRKDPRHRAREAALQILYQWEIGGGDIDDAADTLFHAAVARREPPPDELRAFATELARDTVERLHDDRSADRRHRPSAGGPSAWRCSIG